MIVAKQSVVSSPAALSIFHCWLFSIALYISGPNCGMRFTDAFEYVKAGSVIYLAFDFVDYVLLAHVFH